MTAALTIRELKARGYRLWAACAIDRTCTHFADLDLDALEREFGATADPHEIWVTVRARLRCKQCGRRGGAELRIAAPNGYSAR